LTDKEKEYLEKQTRAAGLKIEPYVRSLIAGHEVKERPSEAWAALVRQLSAIGNNINQIARVANICGAVDPAHINTIIRMQSDIWRKVKDF
jgi:hypothetical protein